MDEPNLDPREARRFKKPVTEDPGPPPPAPPRRFTFRVVGWSAKLLLILSFTIGVPCVLGMGFIVVTQPMPWDNWILDLRGESAEGKIYRRASRESGSVSRGTVDHVFDYYVEFVDRQARTRRTIVIGDGKSEGDVVKIDYDPDNVARARFAGGTVAPAVNMFFVLAPILIALIAGMGLSIALCFRQAGVWRRGAAVHARVVSVKLTSGREGDKIVTSVEYAYQTPSGVQTGKHRMVDPPARGSVVWAVYDPKKPHRSCAFIQG